MKWIDKNTRLEGATITLVPLTKDHFEDLLKLAADKRIWEFYVFDGSDEKQLRTKLEQALVEKENGTQVPFVMIYKPTNAIIGSTRLMDIHPEHRKLEIGWTWLHPDHWATPVNPECKQLLLRFCFDQLHAVRVMLKTDVLNMRSRKAIMKIGATFEGILRHDLLRDNGTKRDSAYFSILDYEWADVEAKLDKLIDSRRKK